MTIHPKIARLRQRGKAAGTGPGTLGSLAAMCLLAAALLQPGCTGEPNTGLGPERLSAPPGWAQEAIWYQIFVERFRNGDPSNDPRLEDIQGSDPLEYPDGWRPLPWTHDWYERADWELATGRDFSYTAQLRRFGGDIQGVLDKIDYLEDLGVTAIYFNPINDAPSLHKYDARNYRHVDRNFGPDPDGDAGIMALEDPADPATWRWTSADSLFLALVRELHAKGMRVIVDYSWNHTGLAFWAWQDLVEKQGASAYADWYRIERFDDPATPGDEFSYRGWAGVRTLPELRKTGVPDGYDGGPVEGDLNEGAKAHVIAVTRRWLDPDGDGDPSDGVDGFRLDVAEKVPLGFWRDYRAFVRSVNPEAYLVGEVWWEKWPDRMMDPGPYLGIAFDAVMNYRWYMPTRSLVASALPELSPSAYVAHLDSVEAGIPDMHLRAMMNVAATHDSPRLSTSLYNRGRYKHGVNPRDNPDYRLDRPDARADQVKRMLLVQQFTYYGAPHIWYGDEVGMWGADDPDNRKPMVWADYRYDPEDALPDGSRRPPDPVEPDTSLLAFYKRLTRLRAQHAGLFARGATKYVLADDDQGVLGYERGAADDVVRVYLNRSDEEWSTELPGPEHYRIVLSSRSGDGAIGDRSGDAAVGERFGDVVIEEGWLRLPGLTAVVVERR